MLNTFVPSVKPLLSGELNNTAVSSRPPEEEVLNLHRLFRPRLLRYAVSLGLKPQDAEDVIQETFLALFCHLQAEKPRTNLPGWTFRVTHRLALKRRTQYREADFEGKSREQELAVAVAINPEDEVLFDERHRRLQSIFRALPEIDRLCLQLRSEGLKYREIASVLNVSLGLVHKSLSRSLIRLV